MWLVYKYSSIQVGLSEKIKCRMLLESLLVWSGLREVASYWQVLGKSLLSQRKMRA